MKHTLLLMLVFVSMMFGHAQPVILTLTPNPIETSEAIDMNDPLFELVGYATITNVSADSIAVRWRRIMPAVPMGWEVLVCDNSSCYPPFVSSNVMPEFDLNVPIVLAPGATSNLDVHVRPNQFPGSATIDVALSLANDTTIISTGVYHFTASLTSSVNSSLRQQDIRLFPNPTAEYFQLSPGAGISRVVVYNTLGRAMRSYDVYDGRRYSLAGLPDGMYLVSLFEPGLKSSVKTIRVIKRGFRP
jgi:hypothetical protein